jgi:ribosomal protein L11 methyltransferase
MSKVLWRVSVATSAKAEDAVIELISAVLGQSCTAYHDFETGKTTVSAFLANVTSFRGGKPQILEGLRRIHDCGLATTRLRVTCARVRHEDWAESWKKHFKPLEIGRELLIKPSWSRLRAKPGQRVTILDPGLSFGTGHHPTTAFCLKEVARAARENKEHPKGSAANRAFLDAGTGSGILVIAAAKLGFAPADAFDYDPDALRIARANAQRNRVAEKIRFSQQDATKFRPGRKYSLICANLSAEVLMQSLGRLRFCLEKGGALVLAGILKNEFAFIQQIAAEHRLLLMRKHDQDEWTSGTFTKKL